MYILFDYHRSYIKHHIHMKNIFLILFLSICAIAQVHAQAKFGLKLGLSTPSGDFGSFQVNQPDSNLMVSLKGAKYGLHGGIWLRAGNKLFVQPEVYFNSNTNQYKLDGDFLGSVTKSEKYQYLDIPVIFGAKIGPLSLQAGPVGHYFLKSTSDLVNDVPGYTQKFDSFTFGYQAGAGLDFGRIGLDVRYQGRFNQSDSHMSFFGREYQLDKTPASVVAALRFKLF
jgi:Outer membrane protein beta-barrel domain